MKEEVSSISQEWHKRKRPYVVIGTGYVGPHGEDESGRGRLLLYELDYAQYVNHSGSTSGKLPKLRLVFIKEHRQGAISMVSQLGPYVIAAVGSKLIVYEFKSEQLIGCAFYDAQMFIVSISIVKDFIMYGDIYKSVQFLRWKEKQRQLVLLAKDYEPLAVSATEFNLFEKRLALLAVDMEENLHVMQFAPNDIESRGGQRLLRTGDFHLGVQVSSMFRKLVSPLNRSSPVTYVNILGSSEGGISALIPVSERVFRRLFTLQNVMINTLPQNCALNPRDFRTIKTNSTRHSGRLDAWSKQKWKKSFLDAHVLFRFLQLDYVAQKEITRCIGTTPEVVIHNLLEVQRSTSTFL
jgi:cleavage and polyadenylation specificity factor subunit 1